MSVTRPLSAGEEMFALHCKAEKISILREYQFDLDRKWRFDFIILPKDLSAAPTLAVEIEGGVWSGGRHTTGKGFEADCRKYSRAAALGWRVIRVTTGMVKSGEAIALVLEAIK